MARGLSKLKMRGGGIGGGVCPPGVLCMDAGTIFCVICIVVIVLGFLAFLWNQTSAVPAAVRKPVYRTPPEEKVAVVPTR